MTEKNVHPYKNLFKITVHSVNKKSVLESMDIARNNKLSYILICIRIECI